MFHVFGLPLIIKLKGIAQFESSEKGLPKYLPLQNRSNILMALQKLNVLLINQTSAKSAGAVDELYRAHFIILTAPCTTVYCVTILHRVPLCTVSQYCTEYHCVLYHNIAPCTISCITILHRVHCVLHHNIAPCTTVYCITILHRITEGEHCIVSSKTKQCTVSLECIPNHCSAVQWLGCWGGGVSCKEDRPAGCQNTAPLFYPPPPPAICIVNTANFYFGQVKS